MKKITQRMKTAVRTGAYIAAGSALSAGAFAVEVGDGSAVAGALSYGQTAVTTVVAGVIGIVAVVVGLGYVISTLRKS